MWYALSMKSKDVLKAVQDRTGVSRADVARELGITPQATSQGFRAPAISLEKAVAYLRAMGYDLYAVPASLHVDAISDDVIKIEPEERKEKE